MFRSVKTKIIMTVMVLFLIGIATMTTISSTQVKTKTDESISNSSSAFVYQMSAAIENYLVQYGKGLAQLANSRSIADFVLDEQTAPHVLRDALDEDLTQFLTLYSDAVKVYYSNPNHHINMPYIDLGPDYDPTQREWYTNATTQQNEVQWSSPYTDKSTGDLVITASIAVHADGKLIGVVGLDVQLNALTEKISASDVGYEGYPAIFDTEGTAIAHPTLQGEDLMNLSYISDMYKNDAEQGSIYYVHENIPKVLMYTTIPQFGWKVLAVYDEKISTTWQMAYASPWQLLH